MPEIMLNSVVKRIFKTGPEKPINKKLKAVSLCQILNNNTKIDLRFISKTLEKRQQSIDKLT